MKNEEGLQEQGHRLKQMLITREVGFPQGPPHPERGSTEKRQHFSCKTGEGLKGPDSEVKSGWMD